MTRRFRSANFISLCLNQPSHFGVSVATHVKSSQRALEESLAIRVAENTPPPLPSPLPPLLPPPPSLPPSYSEVIPTPLGEKTLSTLSVSGLGVAAHAATPPSYGSLLAPAVEDSAVARSTQSATAVGHSPEPGQPESEIETADDRKPAATQEEPRKKPPTFLPPPAHDVNSLTQWLLTISDGAFSTRGQSYATNLVKHGHTDPNNFSDEVLTQCGIAKAHRRLILVHIGAPALFQPPPSSGY